ncbi:hypothetical protein GCM10010112_43720 [Actinoplanes lobatus]|uniref:Uncharacterized protein n=1 Tax=Actinoplanes lobatus TaxID=113568 RepID=A0A7W7MER7_9ACTN|nr:hypothetical protein [Actinoplanes lobatus]MBB4747589.1 hypothetical protein [Actinoplanes lobatus]GGN74012.1 hypothetical protein GCM10010112_43720 [Actinoplanes lobatus]GIE39850.1 hypothetical protein Alo02nite_27480 [Actinoplanes lobatus]
MSARVPNTITDQQWDDISRRAHKANRDVLSDDATRRRLIYGEQKRKADQS